MAEAGTMPSNSSAVNNPLVSKFQMNPTLSLILACLVFSLMVFVFVYLRRVGRNNSFHGATGLRFIRRRSDTHRGLDPTIIESFPVFVYSDVRALKLDRKNELQLECAVCLHEFEDEETLRLLPQCCHVFHPDCIDAWLAFRATCPLCRCDLKTNPNELQTSILESTDQVSSSVPLPQGGGNNTTVIDIQEVNTSPSSQTKHVANKTPRKKTPYSTPRRPIRILGMFNRSHSTGHSLVQAGEDRERFTLRLPKDVQKRLVDLNLSRSGNNTPFTPERSSAKGYRCKSYKEQFSRPNLLATPPMNLITCGSSSKEVKSEKHQKFVKSIKSPLSLFFKSRKDDDVGERSFAYLRSNPSN